MTQKQKEFIEKNIDLIEQKQWDEFFKNCPAGVASTLYDADIDFMSEMHRVPRAAFYDCDDIKNINIPDGVITVEDYAFYNCSSLTSAIIGNSVTSIGGSAFYDCSSLTSIIIPNGVTSVRDFAFSNCSSLKSITIPDSVTSIGYEAFNNLGSDVLINFNGTKEEWKKIYNSKAFTNTYFTVNCLDGTLHKKKR